jgi:hypothetical protein
MNVFDQAARFLIQCNPLGFLLWLIRGLDQSLRFLGWLDTRAVPFPGGGDRTCDTVAELAGTSPGTHRWAVVVEFQAVSRAETLDRALEYVALLSRALRFGPQRQHRYAVVAAVVDLSGPRQADTVDMTLPGLESPALHFQVAARTLREEDAASTLDAIATGETARCLLGLVSLMRGGGEPGIIERWQQLASEEPDHEHRTAYALTVTIFAELTGCAAAWRSALEDWNMQESTLVAEWTAAARAEGLARGEQRFLVQVLAEKFATPVPPEVVNAIEAQTDPEVLSRWLSHAIAAATLDAFRDAMGRGG